MPLMKILTFNIMSSLIMGIEEGAKRDMLVGLFQQLIKGSLSVPINFPFTRFSRSLQASRKIRMILADLIRERRAAQKEQTAFPQQDLITTLLNLRNEDSSAALSDEEIVDNAITIMIAGHDTISVLLTTLIRNLANDQAVYAGIAQGMQLN
jgi:cytochrome P450 family 26 subfamily A